jgi:hypothetical protein
VRRVAKRLLIGGAAVAVILFGLAALAVGFYIYITRPIAEGQPIAGGAVTPVVTGRFGPEGCGMGPSDPIPCSVKTARETSAR